MSKHITKFVGFDVSKETIAVAIADEGREPARYWGSIPHRLEDVRKLIKKIGEPDTLEICYEAGPTGYELCRWLRAMGYACKVIAPSLMPRRSGDRIKTDRRDALRLAQLLRAGELTAIHIPDEEDERLRDLSRIREDAKEDQHRVRQRLLKFLLRRQIHRPEGLATNWTGIHYKWLGTLQFEDTTDQLVFREYLHAIQECDDRLRRLEDEIVRLIKASPNDAVVRILQGFRGISNISAFTIAHEVITFARFAEAPNAMSYAGLVPREKSSGESTWRGGLTKTGNAHLRRILIEAAWSYRHKPAVKRDMKKRLEGLPPEIQRLSWNAQNRLHKKYYQLVIQKGKHPNVAVAAVARELTGFLWAAVRMLNPESTVV